MPQNAVTAIVQSRDGYLWLGTYSGLVRFDGARFVLFDNSNTPQLRTSRVTSLYEDPAGVLWIGQETGEVMCCKQGRFEHVQREQPGKARRIFGLGMDEFGDLWIMNEDGLVVRSRDNLVLVPPIGAAAGQLSFAVDRANSPESSRTSSPPPHCLGNRPKAMCREFVPVEAADFGSPVMDACGNGGKASGSPTWARRRGVWRV